MGAVESFMSLLRGKNKNIDASEQQQGVVSELLPELNLQIEDKELLELKSKWENAWNTYYEPLKKQQEEAEQYWSGKQYMESQATAGKRPLIDNRVFSAVETFLPIATRQNPEPLVNGDNSEGSEELADKVGKMLGYQTDIQRLRLKLKKAMRFWILYKLGVAKVGWDLIENDIKTVIIRPQRLILDPKATIDEDGYTGEYVGEHREDTADILAKRFPAKKAFIEKTADGNMATKIAYQEWWTNDYLFWTLEKEVLGKAKNPHWNYGDIKNSFDENGQTITSTTDGKNHFNSRKKPYIFLSVFNTGMHPHDDTSLIEQVLPLQDLVNKRMRQIDKNVDGMNGGAVVSGDHFTMDEAAQVSEALRKGATVWVPNGDINAAYRRDQSVPLPSDVYNHLNDARNSIDNSFGTHATTRGEKTGPETATGRTLLKQSDESRVGLISDYLEQFTDQIYNWWVQLMYVYYDEAHVAVIIGEDKAKEYVQLKKEDFGSKLLVSVREGSLIPKDPMIKRNEAIDLWKANAIGPIELFKRLDYPNPISAAEELNRWKSGTLFANEIPAETPNKEPTDIAASETNPVTSDLQSQAQAIAQQIQA